MLFHHKHASYHLAYRLVLGFSQPVPKQVAEDAAAMIGTRASEVTGDVLDVLYDEDKEGVIALTVRVRLPPTIAISDWMRPVKTSTSKALCNRYPDVARPLWTRNYVATTEQPPEA